MTSLEINEVAYLPNQVIPLPKSESACHCEDHPDRIAVMQIVGETDSFGSEFIYACQECLDNHREMMKKDGGAMDYICDRCKKPLACLPARDPNEGNAGPVYWVCASCARIMAECDLYF